MGILTNKAEKLHSAGQVLSLIDDVAASETLTRLRSAATKASLIGRHRCGFKIRAITIMNKCIMDKHQKVFYVTCHKTFTFSLILC